MRSKKTAIFAAGIFVLLGAFIIVSVSFAWLDVSRVPFVSDLSISVISDNDLKITPDVNQSPDEERWSSYLLASEFIDDCVPLKPVTYKKSINDFQKLVITENGRTSGGTDLLPENINARYLDGVKTGPVAAQAEKDGYIVYVDYWLKTEGASANVFLQEPVLDDPEALSNGTYVMGAPEWVEGSGKHVNGASGSETTLRIGFQIWYTDMDGALLESCDGDPVLEKNPAGVDVNVYKDFDTKFNQYSEFFVYEPNVDVHPRGGNSYVETASVDGGLLVDEDHLILQNASTWTEKSPALADEVEYHVGEFLYGEDGPLILMRMTGSNMAKVRMWIWMEGQDADCTALNVVEESSVIANIDFGVEASGNEINVHRK